MDYWGKKEELEKKARKHTFNVEAGYKDEIASCVQRSIVYSDDMISISSEKKQKSSYLFRDTTVDALFKLRREFGPRKRICVLNFASYRNPGGKFLEGSSTQEESLCHASFLYNVLKEMSEYYEWNRRNLNKGLYFDRAIYSSNVRFFNDTETVLADVLTCAAPNRLCLVEHDAFTEEENTKVLVQRTRFIKSIIGAQDVDIAILGAWGCGVFKQDSGKVANLFMGDGGVQVNDIAVYAIPDDKTYGVFLEAMEKHEQLPF